MLQMTTPIGPIPVAARIAAELAGMFDHAVADRALRSSAVIDPEAFAKLCDRRLSGPGLSKGDSYAMIRRREARTHPTG